MNICQDHWHDLKNAIRQRGLWRLVTPSGYRAAETPQEILELNAAQYAFDPLMAAILMISEQARHAFSSALATGVVCPLCEVERNLGTGMAYDWIDTDTEQILQLCRERRLVRAEE